jgi:hypothetical protein
MNKTWNLSGRDRKARSVAALRDTAPPNWLYGKLLLDKPETNGAVWEPRGYGFVRDAARRISSLFQIGNFKINHPKG